MRIGVAMHLSLQGMLYSKYFFHSRTGTNVYWNMIQSKNFSSTCHFYSNTVPPEDPFAANDMHCSDRPMLWYHFTKKRIFSQTVLQSNQTQFWTVHMRSMMITYIRICIETHFRTCSIVNVWVGFGTQAEIKAWWPLY